jgi:hypothetical protein
VTYVVLFVLGVAWTWYLVTWLRNRTENRGVNSISSFSKHLSVLERATPGAASAPKRSLDRPEVPGHLAPGPISTLTRTQAQQRRKSILSGLGLASMATLLGAGLLGGLFAWAFVAVLAVTVAYVTLLVRSQRLETERRGKVRYLPSTGTGEYADEPVYLLQRSGS